MADVEEMPIFVVVVGPFRMSAVEVLGRKGTGEASTFGCWPDVDAPPPTKDCDGDQIGERFGEAFECIADGKWTFIG